ncbi:MAG: hypothetical protein NZ959_12375 [Armatimonadetes bacterium]|nr:hypothetical protein [Armatimonadota bacterium]MDW8123109.1 hypothetical protein [Armatimonadota bacterium]
MQLQDIAQALKTYSDKEGAAKFFARLGYPTLEPRESAERSELPDSARRLISSMYPISDLPGFRIYHLELTTHTLRRTDFRRILDPFYRRFPQNNYLFVFTVGTTPYKEIAFVSPQRLLVANRTTENEWRPTVRLRTLRVIPNEPYHTDLEVLRDIANPSGHPEEIWKKHLNAFNVERVTQKFFEEYRQALDQIIESLRPAKTSHTRRDDDDSRFAFAQLFLNRLMLSYFVARKGWMKDHQDQQQRRYFRWLWRRYREERERHPNISFYDWLCFLFRDAFNNNLSAVLSAPLPNDVRDSFLTMPYLNGSLFRILEPDYDDYEIPDSVFSDHLFGENPDHGEPKLLERYNFTVDESRPYDEEVAVDPEMLGKVYESLIAEVERGKSGIFYTPRLEVDLMCRLSVAEYLHQRHGFDRNAVLNFLFSPFDPNTLNQFTKQEQKNLEKALKKCRIVDPAVGSGSFLVGMLNVLCEALDALANALERKRDKRFELKRHLILNNLYGVDVKDWAVRACELRLFFSLLTELEDGRVFKNSENPEPILPYLDFRIRIGDSLVQEVRNIPKPIILRKQRDFYLPLEKQLKTLAQQKQQFEQKKLSQGESSTQLNQEMQKIFRSEQEISGNILRKAIEAEKDPEAKKQVDELKKNRSEVSPFPFSFGKSSFQKSFTTTSPKNEALTSS